MEGIELKSALGVMTLLGIKGIGRTTALNLIGKFETLGDAMNAGVEGMKGLATEPIRRTIAEGGNVVREAAARAADELAKANDIGATVLTPFDHAYPVRLSTIKDMPLVLYTSGDLNLLDRSVACVGTREPTQFGAAVASRLTTMLGEAGWTIVSGLARGVDSICHEAALACGAPTVAILGSGIDTYSSDAAYRLVSRIVEAGGVVMTEQPLGKPADPASLIKRNRLQTGSSVATFFMQADMESGTMHSVRYALLQGRPIFAPGIPANFAGEPLNQAAMCMTRMAAAQFGQAIEAKEEIMDAISRLDRPHVAYEIAGRDRYPEVLATIEAALQAEPCLDQAFALA